MYVLSERPGPGFFIESVTGIVKLLRMRGGNWVLGSFFEDDDVSFGGEDAKTELY